MYDELIKNLRHDSASALQNCDFDFVHDWMLEAADAIEELQKQLREEKVDNVNLTGWLAEEHAKVGELQGELQALKNDTDMAIVEDGKTTRLCFVKKWIPVTERLPKNHQHCLVFTDTHRMGYFAKNLEKVDEYDFQGEKHHGWYYLDSEWGYCEIRNVTHWMPLPQPPEEETDAL